MNLCKVKDGGRAVISGVGSSGSLREHLLSMGLVPGTEVTLVKRAPMGDPLELRVHSYSLTLRQAEASGIEVDPVADRAVEDETQPPLQYMVSLHEHNSHPGLGEAGRYHDKTHEHPLPKGTELTFALAGQQNCGKTTLFNQLTGSNQHVGNFPGVTVEGKSGTVRGHSDMVVTDLPGFYSLSTYTEEEKVSRDFLLKQKPKCIINIIDAGNIERNLYLTVQLMELDIPMVLAVNMMDELTANGGAIYPNAMERYLGIPVVPVSAAKGEGIEELVEHAAHIARYREAPARHDFCDPDDAGGAVHRCIHSIMTLVEDHASRAGLPLRFVASRLVEGDSEVLELLGLDANEKEMLEHIIVQMEQERGLDRNAAMADMRYAFIGKFTARTVMKPHESKETVRTRKIDRVLTGKWTALPAFIGIIALVFYLTFDVIGSTLQDLLQSGIDTLAGLTDAALVRWEVTPTVRSLVIDAFLGGVGTVVSFVPIIIVLFFFLSLLEDSGYMARIAFISDRLLRKLGLSGRSIVPLLIGFGCTVPGVMASRTLPSAIDRKRTVMLTPFMSCSAKIAIYGFFAAAFFPGHAGLVMTLLYLMGIFVGIIVALVSKYIHRNAPAAPFVMELPVYRMPVPSNVGHLLWDKTKDFLQRAFTVIFVATVVIWMLQSFDARFNFVHGGEGSMLCSLAGVVAPVLEPLGLGDWRIVTSLISGLLAKESVVASLEMLGVGEIINSLTAVPMLVFCLLYSPCIAAIASVRRELGSWWALYMVVFQCAVAWICAFAAYHLALVL